jgi:2-hydroxy-3-oxopropionate reductase
MVTAPATLAFLGTGLMGYPMAANLLKAGFTVRVWNRTKSKAEQLEPLGAAVYDTPAGVVQNADAVITMLENGAVVTEVLFGSVLLGSGAVEHCAKNTLIIDMSSIAPAIALDHANVLQAKNLHYLDAPVSGGTIGAENGTLAIMAGGLESDINDASAIFAALGKVTHVGPHGRGQLCKLVNQSIVAVTIGAVAEGLLLAKAGGADPVKVREAIMGGFCQSRILELHGKRMIERNFEPGGLVKNQLKDLNAVLEVARELNLTLPLTEKVRELFVDLVNAGREGYDHSALLLQLEALNHISS